MEKTLRLILGDQLNVQHSWYGTVDNSITYVMMEMRQETDYTTHHIQKIVAFFAAMRKFAAQLQQMGHNVIYLTLDDPDNTQSLAQNLARLISNNAYQKFEYQLPDEYRLDQQLIAICQNLGIPSQVFDTEHFIMSRDAVGKLFGQKNYLMETFYRKVRSDKNWLMENGQPKGGKWNYDHDNRRPLPKGKKVLAPLVFHHNHSKLVEMITKHGIRSIGSIDQKDVIWPVDRQQSLEILSYFLENCLQEFGQYQDALSKGLWSMYHSRISFSLNTKLISPTEVIEKTLAYYNNHQDVPIQAVEGFIRQIAGWREFVRGVYWAKMPAYANKNEFGHQNKLPSFYWDGNTKMSCLKDAITQSLEKSYAHHIQRLMLTGNFALLTMTHPDEVDTWYLGIYIDAIEWVEMPNTRGMSQYADGGVLATKPYISSANYINKMSNYCASCQYDPSKKTGSNACPFNSLYWNFLIVHEDMLSKNPRMTMMYAQLNKMDKLQKKQLQIQAADYLRQVDRL